MRKKSNETNTTEKMTSLQETLDSNKEIIEPQMATNRKLTVEVDGVKIPLFFSTECFQSALNFKPKFGDIFIATYPKCGTTWMQNVVLNILRRGKPLDRPRDFFLASPFLDQLGVEDSEKMMIRPGAYKTHLPFGKVPWSDEAKYVFVARNPKDCCVSFYHHMKQIPGYQYSDATFQDFFELFMAGDLEFNCYFSHFLSWYNERSRPNVLFTTYEDMKNNLRDVVLKVADFIDCDAGKDLQANPDILSRILHNCSFEEMKFINTVLNSLYRNVEEILADPSIPKGRKHIIRYNVNLPRQEINFIRKGEVGAWRSVFTSDQNRRMNEKIKTIAHCSDVIKIWGEILH